MPNFFYQRHTFKLFGFVWNINHDQINNKFRKIDKQLIMSITQVNDQIFTSSHLDDRLPQHKVRSNSLLVPTRASTSMSIHEQKQQYRRSQWQHEEKPFKKKNMRPLGIFMQKMFQKHKYRCPIVCYRIDHILVHQQFELTLIPQTDLCAAKDKLGQLCHWRQKA